MTNTNMVAVDGRDALAYVILRPGADSTGVVIEAAANGISKAHAAYALRHTAQSWDPDDAVGQNVGAQLKAAHAEIERLRAELAKYVGKEPTIAEEMTYLGSEVDRLVAQRDRALELIETSAEAFLGSPSANMRAALAVLRSDIDLNTPED
jgi:hypothetical protein